MEWFVIIALVIFIGGLGIVTSDALKHANQSSRD